MADMAIVREQLNAALDEISEASLSASKAVLDFFIAMETRVMEAAGLSSDEQAELIVSRINKKG